jgi:hypothetical protein
MCCRYRRSGATLSPAGDARCTPAFVVARASLLPRRPSRDARKATLASECTDVPCGGFGHDAAKESDLPTGGCPALPVLKACRDPRERPSLLALGSRGNGNGNDDPSAGVSDRRAPRLGAARFDAGLRADERPEIGETNPRLGAGPGFGGATGSSGSTRNEPRPAERCLMRRPPSNRAPSQRGVRCARRRCRRARRPRHVVVARVSLAG